MLNFNPISNVNRNSVIPSPAVKKKQENQTVQTNTISNVTPDFSVKTPLKYTKTGEINLPFDTKAHMYKLSNGQKVIIVPNDGETVVKTYVNTGSMNEPDKLRGISHYIEHNLFNGSEGLEAGEFFKTTDKMGAETNASTGLAETNYYISSYLLNDGDLEKKIKIHASMLETPRFAADMLFKEKGIVNSEINMITSNPENIAFNRTLKNLFSIKTKSSDIIAGTTDNITNLSREDVVDYFNRNYYPANMVTVISGEVKPEETMQLVSKYFTSNKPPVNDRHYEELTPLTKTVREDIISDKAVSTIVAAGFKGPENNNAKDRIYMKALGILLTSSPATMKWIKPLNTHIFYEDEKISTKQDAPTTIMFSSDTNEENAEKILKILYQQITNRANTLPTEDEMLIVKKRLLNSFSEKFEYSALMNNLIGESILEDNMDYINNFEKIVNDMKPEDIMNTAKKYLDLNKTAITVVHPADYSEKDIKDNYNNTQKLSFTGARQKKAVNLDNVKQYDMPGNNFRIVTNNTKNRNASVKISFRDDLPRKTAKPAIAFILSELLNEGSMLRKHAQFSNDNEKKGIQIDFASGVNIIECNAKFDAEDMGYALNSAKEVLLNPRFTQESLDNVKAYIKDSILRSEKNPYKKLDVELFKGTLLGYSENDILNSLDNVTLDDVKALYSSMMNDAKATITISAPFEKNPQLKEILFSNVAQMPKVKKFSPYIYQNFTPVEQTKVLTDTHNKNQANIVMAYKFNINENLKDNTAIELMNIILGGGPSSRLFNDLREQQKLAYSVRSGLSGIDTTKVLNLTIGTTTENKDTGEISYDNLKKSIEGFKYHVNKLKTEKVSQEELDNAKLAMKNRILAQNESNLGKTEGLDYNIYSVYGLSRENQILEMIDKITVDDIYNTANYIFKEKPTYSIVATENTLKANEDYLKSLAA